MQAGCPHPARIKGDIMRIADTKERLPTGWLPAQNAQVHQDEHRDFNPICCATSRRGCRERFLAPGFAAEVQCFSTYSPGARPWRAGLSAIRHHQHLQREMRFLRVCSGPVRRHKTAQCHSAGSAGCYRYLRQEPHWVSAVRGRGAAGAQRVARHDPLCRRARDSSVDSHDVARHERNRGLPDVCKKIKRANAVFAELGIQTTASVTASKLIDDYDKLPDFLAELGFKSCTFSYPLTSLASSYLSFSDSSLVSYGTDELIEVFEKIKRMKQ